MMSVIASLGLLGSYGAISANLSYGASTWPAGFLTPILGQVLGTAIGGSVQTVLSSLSSF